MAGLALLTAGVLAAMGRTPWCACGSLSPVSFDVWSRHNSQHLLDAYSFSHFQHGLLFFAAAWLFERGRRPGASLVAAVALEAAWEIVENTPLVIDRYRAATVSLDYAGDSVANSMADLACCALGWLVARRLPWWGTALLLVGIEGAMVLAIRDSLLLNVWMLVAPSEAVRAWQAGDPG